jgi:hypothetical protein
MPSSKTGKTRSSALGLARTLRVTANNLDPIGMNLVGVIQLKVDVLDNEGPNVVAESVGVEVSLSGHMLVCDASTPSRSQTNLKRQPRFDLVREYVGDCFVEVEKDLHGELGLYAALGDEVVKRVCEGAAQTVLC